MFKKGKQTIGIALGGGGTRGAAHIGVLQGLHRGGIRFDRIVGTSAGAVVGAMYAATMDPEWIEQRFKDFLVSENFKNLGTDRMVKDRDPHSPMSQIAKRVRDQFVLIMSLNKTFILKKERLKNAFSFLLPVKTFEELKISLQVTATDIQTGEYQIYSSGDLLEAVVQSGSIPGYTEPTYSGDKIIVDGGVGLPNPVSILKPLVDFTIAVDVKRTIVPDLADLNIYEILQRSELIGSTKFLDHLLKEADFVIRPNTMNIHWSQFNYFNKLLENGRKSAEENLSALEKKISKHKYLYYRLKQWFVRRNNSVTF